MDRLTSMGVFVRVVDDGGFAAAARAFGMSPAMASKHVQALEDRLGGKLLHRTTRRRSLTDLGQLYLERCRKILADTDAAEASAEELRESPRGTLRVAAPVTFGARRVAPVVVEFMAMWPEVQVELALEDRVVDLVAGRFDAAIRIGRLASSSLVARKLAPYRVVMCAAPSYLATRGTPRSPSDLAKHACFSFGGEATRAWRLVGRNQEQRIVVTSRLRVANGEALHQAALAGAGVVMLPEVLLADDLTLGRLVRVLPTFEAPTRPMNLVYPPDRRATPKLKRFIDLVVARFGA